MPFLIELLRKPPYSVPFQTWRHVKPLAVFAPPDHWPTSTDTPTGPDHPAADRLLSTNGARRARPAPPRPPQGRLRRRPTVAANKEPRGPASPAGGRLRGQDQPTQWRAAPSHRARTGASGYEWSAGGGGRSQLLLPVMADRAGGRSRRLSRLTGTQDTRVRLPERCRRSAPARQTICGPLGAGSDPHSKQSHPRWLRTRLRRLRLRSRRTEIAEIANRIHRKGRINPGTSANSPKPLWLRDGPRSRRGNLPSTTKHPITVYSRHQFHHDVRRRLFIDSTSTETPGDDAGAPIKHNIDVTPAPAPRLVASEHGNSTSKKPTSLASSMPDTFSGNATKLESAGFESESSSSPFPELGLVPNTGSGPVFTAESVGTDGLPTLSSGSVSEIVPESLMDRTPDKTGTEPELPWRPLVAQKERPALSALLRHLLRSPALDGLLRAVGGLLLRLAAVGWVRFSRVTDPEALQVIREFGLQQYVITS